MKKIVWILGAGFSKPLGGPLLDNLFHPNVLEEIKAAFPDRTAQLDSLAARVAHYLYQWGRRADIDLHRPIETKRSAPNLPPERIWDNAETFLETLEEAGAGHAHPHLETFTKWLAKTFEKTHRSLHGVDPEVSAPDPRDILLAAKRILAAQCSAFLEHADLKAERWRPYLRWVDQLDADQAIVTFNYDRVLEVLSQQATGRLGLVRPRLQSAQCPDGIERPANGARVYKLHGSVDWRRHTPAAEDQLAEIDLPTGRGANVDPDPHFALSCERDDLALATPGPAKQDLIRTTTLRFLWDAAEKEIKDAEVIVFLGYRFPPSDTYSLERLLGAMASNQVPYLDVHSVLGPDRARPDSVRLQGLFAAIVYPRSIVPPFPENRPEGPQTACNLVSQPMYVEDFLSVITGRRLRSDPWRQVEGADQ